MENVSRSDIESKLEALRQQLIQLQAHANAVSGAIQFAEALLVEPTQPTLGPVVSEGDNKDVRK